MSRLIASISHFGTHFSRLDFYAIENGVRSGGTMGKACYSPSGIVKDFTGVLNPIKLDLSGRISDSWWNL